MCLALLYYLLISNKCSAQRTIRFKHKTGIEIKDFSTTYLATVIKFLFLFVFWMQSSKFLYIDWILYMSHQWYIHTRCKPFNQFDKNVHSIYNPVSELATNASFYKTKIFPKKETTQMWATRNPKSIQHCHS